MSDRSRSLEGISDEKDSAPVWERRRVPRLDLTTEQFRLQRNGRVYPVVNLSTTGMAIRVIELADLQNLSVGADLSGTVNLHGEKFHIVAQVRNVRGDVVGCQFEDLPDATREGLARRLDPEVLGSELRPMPAQESDAIWFHGSSGTDILFWTTPEDDIRRVAVFIYGTYIQWDAESGLTTGRAHPSSEAAEHRGVVRMETLFLEPDPHPDPGKLTVAKGLILSSNLPEGIRNWCSAHLQFQ